MAKLTVARALKDRVTVNMVLEAEHVAYLRDVAQREGAQSLSAVFRAIIEDFRARESRRTKNPAA